MDLYWIYIKQGDVLVVDTKIIKKRQSEQNCYFFDIFWQVFSNLPYNTLSNTLEDIEG